MTSFTALEESVTSSTAFLGSSFCGPARGFLLFVDVFHLSNNDAVKERKKGTFLQSAIDFHQYLLEFNFELNLENFS